MGGATGGTMWPDPARRAGVGSSMMKPCRSASQAGRSTSQGATTASTCGSATSTYGASFEGDRGEDFADEDPMAVDDPQSVSEYAPDIYKNLSNTELMHAARPDYMDAQKEINPEMRAILVDWLVGVQIKYKLKSETLYLTVNLIDRYLEVHQVMQKEFQLVGVTAMLIASKFEEIYPPEVRDFVYICADAFTREEILDMEVRMLTKLQFVLCSPTFGQFLERYAQVTTCPEEQRHLMQYLCELTLAHLHMLKYPPSQVAASAVLLSNKLLRQHPSWPVAMSQENSKSSAEIEACAMDMCEIYEMVCHERMSSPSKAIFRKFCGPRLSRVATRLY